ncbi:HEAT repeat domain-containing protein [Maribacter sp.]|uniref:HEAT repeat domain-containing protein n=1 Tax=Maribacter sp. TaxID=1897614 RepID=UPI0025B7B99D|nr:hypothetical protein [Maribacter sp.]
MIPPNQIKISLITAPEFNLEYLWWLTILFFVLAVIYFIGVFIIRNRITLKNSRTKDKKVEFSPMINEFLFYEDSNTKEEKMNYLNLKVQIRELIKNNFDREVLTEVLLDLRKDLSGNSQSVLIELYQDLGLHHDAYEKLKSSKWQVVSSGILELTTMEVEDSYGLIVRFINHRQSTIRKQAEIAVVNLKEEGIKYFLDNTKYKIAEWQQLKLLDVLRHKPNYTPPQFGLWLTSTNTHVVLFALRLIKYYNQSDAEQSIITLLKHKKREIQAEAIECIKEFHFVNALLTLKLVYTKASHDIKISILDAIGELGTIADVPFLENLQLTERNFNIKGKVIGTLNKIDPERILPTKNIATTDFYDVELDELSPDFEDKSVEIHEEMPLHNTIDEIDTEIEVATAATSEQAENLSVSWSSNEVDISSQLTEEAVSEEITEEKFIEEEFVEEVVSEEAGLDEKALMDELFPLENRKINSIDDIDLSFLPHIKSDYSNEDNIEETEEAVAELVEHKAELEPEEELEEGFSFNFLPLVVDEITVQEEEEEEEEEVVALEQEEFNPLFDLYDSSISYEHTEKVTENYSDESEMIIDEIDWSTLSAPLQEQNDDRVLITDADTEETIISFEDDGISFSPNFMPQEELDAMVLLENIAELGDCRELILLYQIIDEHSSDVVINRANELIQKFAYQAPRPSELFSDDHDLAESVFTEVYHLADDETKLVLLNEMMIVGDQKEIQLLESILESESKLLVEKATEVLDHIKAHLSNVLEKTTSSIDEEFIFDLDFELEMKEPTEQKNTSAREQGSTLFDQLCAMSNSLYNKKNG